jgi:glycosyltransferase involved in cell wall biosynthesis
VKPRVLLVGRTRYRLPLDDGLRQKFDALGELMELRVLASAAEPGERGDDTFRLAQPLSMLDGTAFYALLPFRIAREVRAFRPDAVMAQTAYEAAAALVARRLSGRRVSVVVDVHADWRASTRLYGSGRRPLLAPLGDRVAAWAIRRADAVRTVSPYTTRLVRSLGVEPTAEFPAYMDLEPFAGRPPTPLPGAARALYVGVLERYKNVDGLADAWRLAAPRLPGAVLRLVGTGTKTAVVERLVAELPSQTSWTPRLAAEEVVAALDASSLLVLPSRSEGMGRVIVEAFCRGRPVLGSRVGGIADLVEDGVNGVLVAPEDTRKLADELVRLLSDRQRLERLGAGALRSAEKWSQTPETFARRTLELVGTVDRS